MLATEGEGMKLTAAEQESLTEGDVITRKVRVRKSGREYGCSIKVGDAVKVGDRVLAVCSARKERAETGARWVIRFEEVGEWALPDPGDEIPEMPWDELKDRLPERLTWDAEPGTRSGDKFIFHWDEAIHHIDGKRYIHPFPAVYLLVTSNPIRHTKGHWWANFEPVGFDRVEYMRHGYGTTPNPLESIDRSGPVEVVEKTPAEKEADELLRGTHRKAADTARARRNLVRLKKAA